MHKITRREAIDLMILGLLGAGGTAYLGRDYLRDCLKDHLVNPNPKQDITQLTKDSLDDVLRKSRETPTIIKFTEKRCSPCRDFGPAFKGAASEYKPDDILFVEYDWSKDNNLSFVGTPLEANGGEMGIPRVVLLYKGNKLKIFNGTELREGLNANLPAQLQRTAVPINDWLSCSWKRYFMKQLETEIERYK